jgi:arginine exporter protein ArgO
MATAFPVGAQSFVVLNQGLVVGYPRVFFGIVTASSCDTLLVVLGAAEPCVGDPFRRNPSHMSPKVQNSPS